MLTTLFFGTPAAAVPFLEKLSALTDVRGVVTSPDQPAGRGYELAPTPVKVKAQALGLPVFQPDSLKTPAALARIEEWGPVDAALVVAYGKLIPRAIFSRPKHGAVNVHFSLLPKYRGAAPVQRALMNGEKTSGVSLFQLEEALDTGPVFKQAAVAVSPDDNAATLGRKLTQAGLTLVEDWVRAMEKSSLTFTPQSGEPTWASPLKKEEGEILWEQRAAADVINLLRGAWEWPGAYTFRQGQRLKVLAAEVRLAQKGRPGEILAVESGKGFVVKCRTDAVLVSRVKPEGKKEMDAASFWNGARLSVGEYLGKQGDNK